MHQQHIQPIHTFPTQISFPQGILAGQSATTMTVLKTSDYTLPVHDFKAYLHVAVKNIQDTLFSTYPIKSKDEELEVIIQTYHARYQQHGLQLLPTPDSLQRTMAYVDNCSSNTETLCKIINVYNHKDLQRLPHNLNDQESSEVLIFCYAPYIQHCHYALTHVNYTIKHIIQDFQFLCMNPYLLMPYSCTLFHLQRTESVLSSSDRMLSIKPQTINIRVSPLDQQRLLTYQAPFLQEAITHLCFKPAATEIQMYQDNSWLLTCIDQEAGNIQILCKPEDQAIKLTSLYPYSDHFFHVLTLITILYASATTCIQFKDIQVNHHESN